MRRSRKRHQNAEIEANLTPMIDVSFLLIVFFALVSGIANREQASMSLSRVREGVAARPDDDARWVLNILPAADGTGYLATVVYEHASRTSSLAILRADALADGPVARARLRHSHRNTLLLQCLQAGGAAAQLLASRPVIGQLALRLLNGCLSRLEGLLGAP